MRLRFDRVFALKDLTCYPGSEFLDMTIFLPWSVENPKRRVWLLAPSSSPTISINDVTVEPEKVLPGPPRWVDYGWLELPGLPNVWCQGEYLQLRVRGMPAGECAAAYLVITAQPELSLEGCSLDEAERQLWGLARCDAGSTTLSPARLTAGSAAHFTVAYKAGPRGLPAGALVRFTVPKAFARPQTADAGAPGYTHVGRADGPVRIEAIEDTIECHEKVDIICRLEEALRPAEGFDLHYDTDRAYILPVEYHETDRRYWYSNLPPLSAAVALSDSASFVSVAEGKGHTFQTVPGPSERLHLFLPGRMLTCDALNLRGTFTDHYRNVPPSGPIDADLELWLVRGDEWIALGSPAAHFVARHRFEVPLPPLAPGVYRAVACRPQSHDEVARSNPLEVVEEAPSAERLFWGEVHGHTEMSDGYGSFSELYRHSREEGCLDFAAGIDHAEYISENNWLWMQDVTNASNEPGRFVTLVGYEWEGKERDRTVLSSHARLPLVRGNYPPTGRLAEVWRCFQGDEEVAVGPHATMAHSTVWEDHDESVQRFAEIYSMWGASDLRDSPLAAPWLKPDQGVTVNDILRSGAHLGFTGGGDCHEGRGGFACEDPEGQGRVPHLAYGPILFHCGLTAALMPALDRRALLRAIRDRRTYATTGPRILLTFTVSGLPMGAVGRAERAECRAAIHAVRPLRLIEIVKDGRVAWSQPCDSLDADIVWRDPVAPQGEHYYYLHVVQQDGEMAWSSPVWVQQTSE